MDKKLFLWGIFIDLKKAFDTVDHSVLLNKFNHTVHGIVNDWFSSYVPIEVHSNNRDQFVYF